MLRPISDERRRTLLHLSGSLCAGSLALLFVCAPGSFTAQAGQIGRTAEISVPSVPDRLSYPAVDLGHDPFIPGITPAMAAVQEEIPGGSTAPIGIVLPPNAGAGAGALPPALGAGDTVVRAVVVGDSARALVEKGGNVNVMQVGDALAGSTIVSIDSGGITLASGIHLALAKDQQ